MGGYSYSHSLQIGEIKYSAPGHYFVSNSQLQPGLSELRDHILFPRILWLVLDSLSTGKNKHRTSHSKMKHALLLD